MARLSRPCSAWGDVLIRYIDAEHISKLVSESVVVPRDPTVAALAEAHLHKNFPLRDWSTIVDWPKLPSSMLDWVNASDDEAIQWALSTAAGQHPKALLLYSGDQPCLVGDFEAMIRHLDELVWKAPGSRIVFGVDEAEDGTLVFTNGLIEFNGKGELFGVVDN